MASFQAGQIVVARAWATPDDDRGWSHDPDPAPRWMVGKRFRVVRCYWLSEETGDPDDAEELVELEPQGHERGTQDYDGWFAWRFEAVLAREEGYL